jgi:hypothetical protein
MKRKMLKRRKKGTPMMVTLGAPSLLKIRPALLLVLVLNPVFSSVLALVFIFLIVMHY